MHLTPQAPQFWGSVERFVQTVSHCVVPPPHDATHAYPLVGSPSQSGMGETQSVSQSPQVTAEESSDSQPGDIGSQSAKLGSHVSSHIPATQFEEPLGGVLGHAFPHAPQFASSVSRAKPSSVVPSQSSSSPLQVSSVGTQPSTLASPEGPPSRRSSEPVHGASSSGPTKTSRQPPGAQVSSGVQRTSTHSATRSIQRTRVSPSMNDTVARR
jgi:hypothetical protein